MANYIVTGASSGIGLELTKQLLTQGHTVIAISNDQEQMNNKDELNNDKCIKLCFDLLNIDGIKSLISDIVMNYGKIKGFVHCAGFDKMVPLYLNTPDLINNLIKLHAIAPLMITGQISRKNFYDEECSIVLISSLSVHEGASGHTAYAMAKGAVEGVIVSAASELMDKKIRINCVILGVVETPMSKKWIDNLNEIQKDKLISSYPLGFGQVNDVCSTISFLLSNKSKWITGQKIILDGGHLSRKA